MDRKFLPLIGAIIGFSIASIPAVFMFTINLVESLLNPLYKVLSPLHKLNLPTGLSMKVILSVCVIVFIIAIRRRKKWLIITSLLTFLFVIGYVHTVGLISVFVYTALIGYIIGLMFYRSRMGVVLFLLLALLSVRPIIYATTQHKEFLEYVERSKKIKSLTVTELSEYFNVDKETIKQVIEKYKMSGWSSGPGEPDWKYRVDRVKEALMKEGIIQVEENANK